MADFQSEYVNATSGIDDVLSTQLSTVLTWSNIPGGLAKVVSSEAGYAWGIHDNSAWMCQLPCNGNWNQIDVPDLNINIFFDIAVDNSNVYLLALVVRKMVLLVGSVNGVGQWKVIDVPFDAVSIFSTQTYIWAQDSYGMKKRCPKPCTMSNWIASDDKDIIITSSSNTALYGKDKQGNAMKSDETLQTRWSPIDGFKGIKVDKVIGGSSTGALYGLDDKDQLLKLDGTELTPLETQGYKPLTMTVDPANKRMWMLTEQNGKLGNVFTRLENPDYTTILNTVNPLDRKRDAIVQNVEQKYDSQTDIMTVNKQVGDVVSYFKKIFNIDRNSGKKAKEQVGHIQDQILETQTQLDKMQSLQPLMQKIILLIAALAVIYIVGSVLGTIVHLVALAVLVGGIYYIVKVSHS
jgi:hypothetical protein